MNQVSPSVPSNAANTSLHVGVAEPIAPSKLVPPTDIEQAEDGVCYSQELANELRRIETEVQQEIDRQRQLELQRQRELARFD